MAFWVFIANVLSSPSRIGPSAPNFDSTRNSHKFDSVSKFDLFVFRASGRAVAVGRKILSMYLILRPRLYYNNKWTVKDASAAKERQSRTPPQEGSAEINWCFALFIFGPFMCICMVMLSFKFGVMILRLRYRWRSMIGVKTFSDMTAEVIPELAHSLAESCDIES